MKSQIPGAYVKMELFYWGSNRRRHKKKKKGDKTKDDYINSLKTKDNIINQGRIQLLMISRKKYHMAKVI